MPSQSTLNRWAPPAVVVSLATALWVFLTPQSVAPGLLRVEVALLLLVGVVVASWWPLTFEYRGEPLHLTLSGVAVLVGLFFVGPLATLSAHLVGGVFALAIRWRNPPSKFVVNLTATAMEVWAAAAVLAAFVAPASTMARPVDWLWVGSAALAAELATTAIVLIAMRMTFGHLKRSSLRPFAAGVLATAAIVTAYAVLAVAMLRVDPWLGLVVIAAMALMVVSNRRRHQLKQRYESLRGLYRFMTNVNDSRDTTTMVTTILDEAASVVGSLEASLFVVDEGRTTRMSNANGSLGVSWVGQDEVRALERFATDGRILPARASGLGFDDLLAPNHDAIAASLGNPELNGVLLLQGRPSHLPTFDTRDVELATAIARHAGAAMAEARLLDRLREERFRVERLALSDTLTGLRNREGLLRDVAELPEGAIIAIGLSQLDQINGGLGQEVGERLIVEAAGRLRRFADDHAMLAAAFGGGRFALVAPDIRTVLAAGDACRQILWDVAGPMEEGPLALDVNPVLGVALAPTHGRDVTELLRAADKALAQAMDAKLSLAWFDADYDRESTERLNTASELRRAIDQGHLTVAYQPKVDLATGEVIGVEALARWPHAQRGMIPPSDFIPIAEQTGLIRPLTIMVAQIALAQAEQWVEAGLELTLAFNLSLAVTQDASIARQIVSLVRSHAVPPESVVVEITESQVMEDVDRGSGVLGIFGSAGLSLSVDDFGTGYSSLAQVKNLPVQELKIDRSFVTDLATNRTDRVIVTSILQLANELGLRVVAEGIEDEATRQLLLEMGCQQAQGFYFDRPLAGPQVLEATRRIPAKLRGAPEPPVSLRERRRQQDAG